MQTKTAKKSATGVLISP